jgi:iron complex outermembrane recepter protein
MFKERSGGRARRQETSNFGPSPWVLGVVAALSSARLVAPPAWGQVGGNAATAPAMVASDNGRIAEIIVTAQRRSESLQATPVAVTVISGDELAAKHIDNISTIAAVTPSITFHSANNAQASSTIRIRGIGTIGNNRAFEGSVGVFVDGVYLSRAGQLLSNFLDLGSLQVLRGPQGTLFGKNTTAGALLLTSVKPRLERYDGSYELTIGDYGTLLARAASNIPVSQTLALRLAGLVGDSDGYVENPNSDDRYNSHRPRALKAQLLFEPNSALTFRLIGDISIEHDNCCYGTVVLTPGPVRPLVSALSAANGLKPPSANPSDYQGVLNRDTDQQIGDRGAVLLSDWTISPDSSLHATTAYRVWAESQLGGDFDFSGADILNGNETFKTRQFSQEFDFNGRIRDSRLFESADYVAGVYFAHESLLATRDLLWGQQAQAYWNVLFAPFPPGSVEAKPGRWSSERYPADDKSYAGFMHVTFHVTDKLSTLTGLRYSEEIKHGAFENPYFDPAMNAVFKAIGVQPGPPYNATHTDRAVSGTAGFQYAFATDEMGYLTYSRGFKAGGINLDTNAAGLVANNPALVPGATELDPTYKAEKIDGLEAGFKADYRDKRARTNVAAFYEKITDLQVAEFLGLQFKVVSAPSARVYGVEIENTYRLTQEMALQAAATWLPRAAIDSSPSLGPPLSGHRLVTAPQWAANLGANLFHPLNAQVALTGRASVQFTSRVYLQSTARQIDIDQSSVTLLNATLGIASIGRSWSVDAWCMNCADQRYYTVTFAVPLQTGTYGAYVGAPRTFGLTLSGHF